jgi:hypothetical protein
MIGLQKQQNHVFVPDKAFAQTTGGRWTLSRFSVRAMAPDPINDYYVITSRRGEYPDRWSWEICRKSKPLGIKMTGDGYQSDAAAQFAGKRALGSFLSDLSKEEKRPRK